MNEIFSQKNQRGFDLRANRDTIDLASLITNVSRRPGQAANVQLAPADGVGGYRVKHPRRRSCEAVLVLPVRPRSTWGVSLTIRSIAFVSQYETR